MVFIAKRKTMRMANAKITNIACVVPKNQKKPYMENGLNSPNVWVTVGQTMLSKSGPKDAIKKCQTALKMKRVALSLKIKCPVQFHAQVIIASTFE